MQHERALGLAGHCHDNTKLCPDLNAAARPPGASPGPSDPPEDGGSCVEARLLRLTRDFAAAYETINDVSRSLTRVRTTPLTVSTITFAGTLDTPKVPIDVMRLAAEVAEDMCDLDGFHIDRGPKRSRLASDTSFKYQLPLKRNGKSLKVFHNGSVHATGCTSPLEFLELVDALRGFLKDTAGVSHSLVDFDIFLVNALFCVLDPVSGRPMKVSPGTFQKSLDILSDFDTERHPSVKIPVMFQGRKTTVCVFQTGSVSIMGAKGPLDVANAYQVVCRALDSCAHVACTPDVIPMRTTTSKNVLFLQHGYPFNAYSCCLPLLSGDEESSRDGTPAPVPDP